MSSRTITREQFGEGTTPDGNRLDRAMDDLVRRVNTVRRGDLARRFVQTQVVAGYLPDLVNGDRLPFMRGDNVATDVQGAVPDAFQNVNRVKGTFVHDSIAGPQVWSLSLYLKRPCILDEVFAFLVTDSAYVNSFTYGAVPPPGKANGDPVDDVSVVVSVDNPWATEERRLDAVEYARHRFRWIAENFSDASPMAATNDMFPPHPGGGLAGMAIWGRDIAAPIHRDARLRLSLVLPHWTGDLTPWGNTPENNHYYSLVLTLLELVEAR